MKCLFAALAVAGWLSAGVAAADTTRIVVAFAAGGPADMLARLVAHDLEPRLGSSVVVENRGGAGGALANEAVARALPDGRTLLLGSMGSQVISPALRPSASYDPAKSFEPLVLIGSVPALLVIRPQLPANTLAQLVAFAKQGNVLSYASAGPGTTMNIAGEMLNAAAGIKTTHVPYRGAGPAINDMLGGHVDLLIADLPVLLPQVADNAVRPLALFAAERSPLLPDVPTAKELGFPELLMENWYGLFVPAGVPAGVQAGLESAVLDVLAVRPVKERLAAGGIFGTMDRAGFKAWLQRDFADWVPQIKKLGIVGE
jgi:tripartite-type tricarboxylate transporter receptor subunit TctC